jgi:CBS domain-containing protein
MLVKEIMTTDVVVLNPYMALRDVARVFAENDISGAPVLDADGNLVGIVTERDILNEVREAADPVKMVYPSIHSMGVLFEISEGEREIVKAFEEAADTVVADVMITNVAVCNPDTLLNDVARTFSKRDINRLPVVDGDGNLVGIVTRGDIIRALAGNHVS